MCSGLKLERNTFLLSSFDTFNLKLPPLACSSCKGSALLESMIQAHGRLTDTKIRGGLNFENWSDQKLHIPRGHTKWFK